MIDTVDMPIALVGGVVYLLMAVTVWRMLRNTPHDRVVRLWALGALCAAAGMVLIASRGVAPRALGFGLSTLMAMAAMLLQTGALRLHLGLARVWRPLLLLLLAAAALLLTVGFATDRRWLFVAACTVLAGFTGQLAWHARLTAKTERSRSATLVAWSQWALMLALLARGASVAAGLSPYQVGRGGFTFVVLHAMAVLAALYGSLGFMGLLLDITRRSESLARDAQVAEAARREAAERATLDLRALLQQRDSLAGERERLLQVLAHEIRQPLHNASGALQAAGHALRAPLAANVEQVAQRLGRAEAVLGDVRSVLDNTLAAATLLGRSMPLAMQEVALDFLVDLALGDLDEAQRARVQVAWLTDQRHAECEPGLVRLALRNLLVNAFGHGGPAVAVRLEIAEQTSPPALLLSVVDDGPGADMARLAPPDAADAGSPVVGMPRLPARGLGLRIVRQVMALHGGSLVLAGAAPQGLRASLVLPLPEA